MIHKSSQFFRKTIMWGLIIGLSAALSASESGKEDWPRWRGNTMDSRTLNTGTFQDGQNYNLKVLWKRELGSGYSSISVVGNRAVTMFSDSTFDYVTMLDANSGKDIWRHKIDSTY